MSSKSKKLAIIVVEFDAPKDTIRCLQTVEKYLGESSKVFIYDNSKHINKILSDFLLSISVPYEYIRNNGNIGFAKACNFGILKAQKEGFDYAMLLNNDTELVDKSALKSIEIFKDNPEIGVLGLKNFYKHDPSKIWHSGKILRKSKIGFKHVPENYNSDFTYCDYVPGSSFIIKLSVIDKIGFLNEDYFAYYEEIDFCFRLKNIRKRVAYINNSKILHKVGASSGSKVKSYLKTRNKLYFYRTILKSKFSFIIVSIILFIKDIFLVLKNENSLQNIKFSFLGAKDFFMGNMGSNDIFNS